jgi:hypothetical protein
VTNYEISDERNIEVRNEELAGRHRLPFAPKTIVTPKSFPSEQQTHVSQKMKIHNSQWNNNLRTVTSSNPKLMVTSVLNIS